MGLAVVTLSIYIYFIFKKLLTSYNSSDIMKSDNSTAYRPEQKKWSLKLQLGII